jgi:hypothetical protein
MPDADELSTIATAIEMLGDGAPIETPSPWRLAGRDFDEVDFEFDRRRSRR